MNCPFSFIYRYGNDLHALIVEYEAPSSIIYPKVFKYSQPPLKEEDFSTNNIASGPGPILFESVKDAGLSSFSSLAGHIVPTSESFVELFFAKCDKKIIEVYPALKLQMIAFRHFLPPSLGGRKISNTTTKYATPISATTDIKVPKRKLDINPN